MIIFVIFYQVPNGWDEYSVLDSSLKNPSTLPSQLPRGMNLPQPSQLEVPPTSGTLNQIPSLLLFTCDQLENTCEAAAVQSDEL